MGILVLTASTMGAEIGIATGSAGHWTLQSSIQTDRRRGRDLLILVRQAMGEAGLQQTDLIGVVVDRGPGSFTGVRLAVTVAKTIGYALRIPVTGVSSLEAMAASAPGSEARLCVVDAGRHTCYVAKFGELKSAEKGSREMHYSPRRVKDAEVAVLGADCRCFTPEPTRLAERIPRVPWVSASPCARGVLAAGMARHESELDASSVHALVPLYLQASAPEQKLDAPHPS